jgi:hypothetical protein
MMDERLFIQLPPICMSGTAKSQPNSPAQIKLPIDHRDLYGDSNIKTEESVPLRPTPPRIRSCFEIFDCTDL